MNNEQAQWLAEYFLRSFEQEAKTTRKVIAAAPPDRMAYAPAEKCMTALDLAFHIAQSEVWLLNCVASASYEWTGGGRPDGIKTPADVVAWYDTNLAAAMDKVRNAPAEVLAREVTVFGPPAANVTYLDFALRHSIHHRGQLSSYLRPMGGKVPSIYGGSADEPWQATA